MPLFVYLIEKNDIGMQCDFFICGWVSGFAPYKTAMRYKEVSCDPNRQVNFLLNMFNLDHGFYRPFLINL